MRKLLPMFAMAALCAGVTLAVQAAEGEKISITGMAQCAKCALKEAPACQNVVVVTKDGDEIKYFLEMNDVSKKAHQSLGFCTAPKGDGPKVKVEGTVEEKDGKKVITPTSIKEAEE